MGRKKEKNRLNLIDMLLNIVMMALILVVGYIVVNYIKFNNVIENANNCIKDNLNRDKTKEVNETINFDNINCYNFNNYNNNRYYYSQLNDNSKIIYNQIEENMNNMKDGIYKINLSDEISKNIRDDNFKVVNQDFQDAWDAIFLDRTDSFFIDVSKLILNIKTVKNIYDVKYYLSIEAKDENGYLMDEFKNIDDVNKAFKLIETNSNEIINNADIKKSDSDYEKIKKIHDELIKTLSYSKDFENKNIYNIYGALKDNVVVCEGYSELFKYILDKLNIECILVQGEAVNNDNIRDRHEWNYISLDNKWYGIDVTWDDQNGLENINKKIKYRYFLKGQKSMNKEHFPIGKVSESGRKFKFPDLEKEDY